MFFALSLTSLCKMIKDPDNILYSTDFKDNCSFETTGMHFNAFSQFVVCYGYAYVRTYLVLCSGDPVPVDAVILAPQVDERLCQLMTDPVLLQRAGTCFFCF